MKQPLMKGKSKTDSKSNKQLKDKPKAKPKTESYLKYQKYIRSKEWKEKKEKIYEFYSKKCYCCGRSEEVDGDIGLSIHHNDYTYLYDELNHLDCVIPLCKICHLNTHRNKNNLKRFKQK